MRSEQACISAVKTGTGFVRAAWRRLWRHLRRSDSSNPAIVRVHGDADTGCDRQLPDSISRVPVRLVTTSATWAAPERRYRAYQYKLIAPRRDTVSCSRTVAIRRSANSFSSHRPRGDPAGVDVLEMVKSRNIMATDLLLRWAVPGAGNSGQPEERRSVSASKWAIWRIFLRPACFNVARQHHKARAPSACGPPRAQTSAPRFPAAKQSARP